MSLFEKDCSTCPYIQHIQSGMAERDEDRQETLSAARQFMAREVADINDAKIQAITRGTEDLIGTTESEYKTAVRRYVSSIESHLELVDQNDANDELKMANAQSTCRGPRKGFDHYLFGARVIKCTQLKASMFPDDWVQRPL